MGENRQGGTYYHLACNARSPGVGFVCKTYIGTNTCLICSQSSPFHYSYTIGDCELAYVRSCGLAFGVHNHLLIISPFYYPIPRFQLQYDNIDTAQPSQLSGEQIINAYVPLANPERRLLRSRKGPRWQSLPLLHAMPTAGDPSE